jgi:hypothetical protein
MKMDDLLLGEFIRQRAARDVLLSAMSVALSKAFGAPQEECLKKLQSEIDERVAFYQAKTPGAELFGKD